MPLAAKSGFVLIALAAACARPPGNEASPSRSDTTPLACRRDELQKPSVPKREDPTGQPVLSVSCQESAAPADRSGPHNAWRCTIVARHAFLADLGMELGRATGLDVAVESDVVGRRVTLSMKDGTFDRLNELLADGTVDRPRLSQDGRVLRIRSDIGFVDPPPKKVRLIPLPPGLAAREALDAVCRFALSSYGDVAIEGPMMIVRDDIDALAKAELLVRNLDPAGFAEDDSRDR